MARNWGGGIKREFKKSYVAPGNTAEEKKKAYVRGDDTYSGGPLGAAKAVSSGRQ